MAVRLGVVMDSIGSIKTYKDSTFAMLLAAQARGWEVRYMELADLFVDDGTARARHRGLRVNDRDHDWYAFDDDKEGPLGELDVVLMRKDPPFDTEYIYATYLLELAAEAGTLVVNRPRALRDTNEKLAIARFPQCAPPTLVTRDAARLRAFAAEHGDVILKPLHGMGGTSVFRLRPGDPNLNVVIETLTTHGSEFAMAQRYIPEIAAGDKRILLVDGEPVPYALARVPAPGETRGNLAAGATGQGVPLGERDRWICAEVGPWLREQGLLFVGLDVIGDYLTEINVTSPTCIRELDAQYGLDIAGQLLDCIERRLA
jgi:glutathione synthase